MRNMAEKAGNPFRARRLRLAKSSLGGLGSAPRGERGKKAILLSSPSGEIRKIVFFLRGEGGFLLGGRSVILTGFFMPLLVGKIGQCGFFDGGEGFFMRGGALNHHAGFVKKGGAPQRAKSMVIKFVKWPG